VARLIQNGAELGSATAGVECDAVSGTVTAQTVVVRSGTYAYKFAPSASLAWGENYFAAADGTGPFYARGYFCFTTFPAANEPLLFFLDSTDTNRPRITFESSTNQFFLQQSGGTKLGSNSATLTLNHWYRLELKLDATTNPATIEARYVDCGTSGTDPGGAGTVIASGNDNAGVHTASRLRFGLTTNNNSGVLYADDLAVNSSSGSAQNSWCGSGRIIHLHPAAQGDANGFLVNIGGTAGAANNYTRVNEIPPDDATSYNASAVLNAEDLFRCGASGIGTGDTVNVVCVGVRFANLVGADATAAFKTEIEKAASGTKTQSAAIIPNSTSWRSNSATGASLYNLVTYLDPDGSAWTQATLNTAQIGYIETVANVRAIAVTNSWLSIDYTPTDVFVVALAGAGSLTATVTPYQRITASLTGVGSLSATLTPYQRLTVALAGTGSLSATLSPYQRFTAALTGAGSLTATLTPYQQMQVQLQGAGALAATLTPYQQIVASLGGVGALTATLTPYQQLLAQLAGAGMLAAFVQTISPPQPVTFTGVGGSGFPPEMLQRFLDNPQTQPDWDLADIEALIALGLL